MNLDEKIEFAEKLCDKLIGVERNELSKWIDYLKREKSLEKAIDLAKHLFTIPMLRPSPTRTYQRIYQVTNEIRSKLENMTLEEVLEIFGYTRRILVSKTISLKGVLKRKKVDKKYSEGYKDVSRQARER